MSASASRSLRRSQGKRKRRRTAEGLVERMVELYGKGTSIPGISRATGTSQQLVVSVLGHVDRAIGERANDRGGGGLT